MFFSKSFLNRLFLFCYVCNAKAKVKNFYEKDCKSEDCDFILECDSNKEIDNKLKSLSTDGSTFKCIIIKGMSRMLIKSECYHIPRKEKENLEKFLCLKEVKYLSNSSGNSKVSFVYCTYKIIYNVEIDENLKNFLNTNKDIESSKLLDGKKITKEEINNDYFIKKFCNVNFVEKDIENCKAEITYNGDIKKFEDENKGYILMCKMNKELTEELEKIQKNIEDEKFTDKYDFEVKFGSFFSEFNNLVVEVKNKFKPDFDRICISLETEFSEKKRKIENKIKEKQKYLIDTLDGYLKELNDPKKYSDVETKFTNFVSDEESKYKSLLEGDILNNYDNKKSEINTKINEIEAKILEYNTLKVSIATTINNIIGEVKSYDVTKTIEEFNTFIVSKRNSIFSESIKLTAYKNYVDDYNVFFKTLVTTFNTEVNNKKSEIELDKLKDKNVKNICNVINKSINDYIASFDSITDIDDSKLELTETNIKNDIKSKISTNLDGKINKIADPKINKDEIKTKVNEFFTTDKINSFKSNICSKINNIKDKLKITFTLTVKNTLKLKPEFSTKLEAIKNKYSNGVTKSVTFNNLKSEISDNRNDVKLFVNNSEVNYSEKITKGITINIEFPKSYLIDKQKDDEHKNPDEDPEKHKDPDDDPNKKEKKDQSENNDSEVPSDINKESDNKKGCCQKCSGGNKTKSEPKTKSSKKPCCCK